MAALNRRDDRAYCKTCGGAFPAGFRACPYDGTALVIGVDPLIGSVLDRYEILDCVGEGGLGRVYIAQHVRLERRYALKIPSAKAASTPKVRQRFLQEAIAASRLDHPNVVGVVDYGETASGLIYIVMELADGETLNRHLDYRGVFAPAEALALTRQIAMGLDHAHQRGLIHRDLKPDNIMIEASDGRPRILDFGLAILRELGAAGRLTTVGMVVGSPWYMSPEQAMGRELDPRCDLFALGIILFEMLAGCLPFDGDPQQIIEKHVSAKMPRFAERVPGLVIDPAVEALVQRMISREREDRPDSASAVVGVIDELLDQFTADRVRARFARPSRDKLPQRGRPGPNVK
jgi:eukaryotic-like serine/threonine-protein kinase